jgi:hypothetical protein
MSFKLIFNIVLALGVTAFAGSLFLLNNDLGFGVYGSVYLFLGYLMFQGLQFNLHGVSTITDSAIDLLISIIPLFMAFYLFITGVGENPEMVFLRNVFMFIAIFDFIIIGWASLKLLLYTDRNAV